MFHIGPAAAAGLGLAAVASLGTLESALAYRAFDHHRAAMTCGDSSWGELVAVPAADGSTAAAIRFSNIAASEKIAVIAGNDLSRLSSEPLRSTFVAQHLDGRPLQAPDGPFSYAFPKVGIAPDGLVHVLWGEADGAPPATSPMEWLLRDVTSVWTAAYDPARGGWTKAQRLYQVKTFPLLWNNAISDITWSAAGAGTAALIPLSDPSNRELRGRATLLAIHHADGGWKTEEIFLPGSATYGAMASTERGAIAAFVGKESRGGAGNVVAVIGRAAGSPNWSAPAVLDREPPSRPIHSLLVLKSDSAAHVLWRAVLDDGTNVIRHRSSSDLHRWSRPSDLSIPRHSGGETAAVDRCGRVHLIYEEMTAPGDVRLMHAVLEEQWETPTVLFAQYLGTSAHLSRAADGELILSFVGSVRDRSATPRTYMARDRDRASP